MYKPIDISLANGLVTAKSEYDLSKGELAQAEGIYYRPGDQFRAHKIDGRHLFGTPLGGSTPSGIVALVFDNSVDFMLAYADSGIYKADLDTGAFTLFGSGIWTSGGQLLGGIHNNDNWYIYNGLNANQVINSSSGIRYVGLKPPNGSFPVITTTSTVGSLARPSGITLNVSASGTYLNDQQQAILVTNGSGYALSTKPPGQTVPDVTQVRGGGPWISGSLCYDVSGVGTYTEYRTAITLDPYDWSAPRQLATFAVSGFASDTGVDRSLHIAYQWYICGPASNQNAGLGNAGWPHIEFWISKDNGATYSLLHSQYDDAFEQTVEDVRYLSAYVGDVNSNLVWAKVIVWDTLKFRRQYAARVHDIWIQNGGRVTLTQDYSEFYYGYTEVDTQNLLNGQQPLESVVAWSPDPVSISGIAGVRLALPGVGTNPNAQSINIYRTFISGTAPQDFTLLDTVPITDTTYHDNFAIPPDEAGSIVYPMVRVVEQYYDRNVQPPAFIGINTYKGSFVGVTTQEPRALYYSPPGLVEYYPSPYKISSFPMPEHDTLKGSMTIGDSLVILAAGGVLVCTDLPIANAEGILSSPDLRRLDGQPGCVGYRAFTTYSTDGAPRGAWVSPFGIHATTSNTCVRLTDDLDWEAMVNVTTLESAILWFDQERQLLVMEFDKDGDGANDHALLLHMNEQHFKQAGRPKITGPHGRKTNSVTKATPNKQPLIYSANQNGNVYIEWSGVLDGSNDYNSSGIVPLIVQTGRMYDEAAFEGYSVFKTTLKHSDWGATEAGTLTWSYGRDSSNFQGSTTKSVSLSGLCNTETYIGRRGDWHQFKFEHYGSGIGSFGNLKAILN